MNSLYLSVEFSTNGVRNEDDNAKNEDAQFAFAPNTIEIVDSLPNFSGGTLRIPPEKLAASLVSPCGEKAP